MGTPGRYGGCRRTSHGASCWGHPKPRACGGILGNAWGKALGVLKP